MKMAVFTFLFMGLASKAAAFYNPEIAIKAAQSLKSPTLEMFLKTVPPEFAAEFLPIYGSRSSQYSDRTFPRILMFNTKMVMTYNGHGFGSNKVEIRHLNPKTFTFDLYDLQFKNKKFNVEKNSTKCQSCHDLELKPLWPSISIPPFWGGIWGSGSASITKAEEDATYSAFIEEQKSSARYGFLPNLKITAPYAPNTKDSISLFDRNGKFERQLSDWAAQALFHKLKKHPRFKQMRAALMAALSCARDDRVFIPTPCKQPWFKNLLAHLTNQQTTNWQVQWLKDRTYIEAEINKESARKRLLIAKKLNIDKNLFFDPATENFYRANEDLLEALSALKLIEREFDVNIIESMSGNRYKDRFEILGPLGPAGVMGQLEKLLYLSATKDHPELELKKYRTVASSSWNKGSDIEFISKELHKLDHNAVNCEGLME